MCALAVAGGCALGPAGDTQGAIARLQADIDAAMIANDPVALGRLLASDATRTGPGGAMTTRAQWLAQMTQGQIRYLAVQRCQTEVRTRGETAIVTGLVDIQVVKPATGEETEHNRYLRVYVREPGGWRLAAHQATKAPAGVRCAGGG